MVVGGELSTIDKAVCAQTQDPLRSRITATPCATLEAVLFSLSTCRSIELLRPLPPHYPIPSHPIRPFCAAQRVFEARTHINTTQPLSWFRPPTWLSALETPEGRRKQAHCSEAQLRRLVGCSVVRCSSLSSRMLLDPACLAPAPQHRRLEAFSARSSSRSRRSRMLAPVCSAVRLGRTSSSSSNSNSNNSHSSNKARVYGVRRSHSSSSSSHSNSNSSATACSVLRCSLRQGYTPTRRRASSRRARASHSCANPPLSSTLALPSPATVRTTPARPPHS